MNKKKLIAMLVASTMVVSSAAALSACGGGDKENGGGKKDSVLVWVSETEGVKTLTEQQVKTFLSENKDYEGKYNVTVEGISEGEAATNMVTDVSTGADIFCYAQDQMGRLIEAKALSKLGTTSVKFVQDNNDAGSVRASTVGTDVYSYPLTSDNGYFMYYNTDVVKAEHIGDLAAIVADCKAAKQNFSFELEGSAWYTASFFFAAGCTSTWQFNDETNKWKASDNFSDETKGLIALKGMQILTNSGVYLSSSKCADFTASTPSAVVISGTWDAGTAAEALGDKLGVAKLPSFTLNNNTYQLGSYSGFKLMGVKPQTNTERTEFCHKLAQYLTGQTCQQQRLDQFSWGPSNKEAAKSEKAQNNLALKGLAAQSPYSTPQGQIPGGWWDFAKLLGATKDKDEAGLKAMLNKYKEDISKYEQMSEEAMNAFGVIGSIASITADSKVSLAEGQEAWKAWGADLKMVKSEKDGKTIWKTVDKITIDKGDAFKVRQGQSWDVQYGGTGDHATSDGNYLVSEDQAGSVYIVLTLTTEGDVTTGVITFEAE